MRIVIDVDASADRIFCNKRIGERARHHSLTAKLNAVALVGLAADLVAIANGGIDIVLCAFRGIVSTDFTAS
jgi:hypothetical protein